MLIRQTSIAKHLGAAALSALALNVLAIFLVIAGSGGPGLPPIFAVVVWAAYWPSWLILGLREDQLFYPDLLVPLLTNIVVWTILGGLLGLVVRLGLVSPARSSTSFSEDHDQALYRRK
jgi:hypothetical protein